MSILENKKEYNRLKTLLLQKFLWRTLIICLATIGIPTVMIRIIYGHGIEYPNQTINTTIILGILYICIGFISWIIHDRHYFRWLHNMKNNGSVYTRKEAEEKLGLKRLGCRLGIY
jgi:uncharacterized membrane protein